ncbi:ArsR/SmtB family transcription factor [Pseudemcibacter aquimaris]|uniref:ArsR/SmtB family transcription factor n=1 Tax=Pseudemcibacter aquimaris TaxID=2857064 RepID=UPI002012FB31|nr:metalloregulator ArsR/SmtB family transcription factor [Pseudemcibacter aquimaris]MCC3860766.1 metalloregulator ArsR/SmtB family transcription factor [Pseudemcibacter aquimaris]WDU59584.1 metalloregulator ArsR/SmtB family transcription factor [Pseudemcibacter aquimaris]
MATDQLSLIFGALADPTRRGILERLAKGRATVGELSEPYDMSMAAISKHLKVLEKAGLITRTKEAQWRHCQFEGASLKEASDWVEKYKQFWDGQLSSLYGFLKKQDY